MSRKNVEIMRNLLPGPEVDIAQLTRDHDLWAAVSQTFAPMAHPDFECEVAWPSESSTYVGVDGLRQAFLDWTAPWESYYTEIEELIDCADRVVALVHDRARRQGVDGEVDVFAANMTTFRDGKIVRVEFFAHRTDALEAAGLSE